MKYFRTSGTLCKTDDKLVHKIDCIYQGVSQLESLTTYAHATSVSHTIS